MLLHLDLHVTALRTLHPPLIDTFALSFKSTTNHVVFGGDTAFLPELAEFAKGADLLIHEAMLEDAIIPLVKRIGNGDQRLLKHLYASHTSASDAAKIAALAKVKMLAFNHLIPTDDPKFTTEHWQQAVESNFKGQFYLGTDGIQIDLN